MIVRRSNLTCIALSIVLNIATVAFNARAADWNVEAVVEQALATQAKLRRLYVDLYMTTTIDGKSQTDRHAVAVAPERCFVDFMHQTDPDDQPWRDNARFQLWLVPSETRQFLPFSRSYFPVASAELQSYWRSPYPIAIGWRGVGTPDDPSNDVPYFLDELTAAANADNSLLLDTQMSAVDSQTCLLLSTASGSDQLWLAPDRNFAVVKRIIRRGDDGVRKTTWRCRELSEVEPGLWLPRKIEATIVEGNGEEQKLIRTFRLDVQTLAVNDAVTDEIFEFVPPPGTLTMDADGRAMDFTPGGEDLMTFWSLVCAEAFPPRSNSEHYDWTVRIAGMTAAIGAALVALMVLNEYRVKSRRRP